MNSYTNLDRRVLWVLGAMILSAAGLAAIYNPASVSFRSFSLAEFVQLTSPLVMVSLFIERVLEVALTSWRSQRTVQSATAESTVSADCDRQKTLEQSLVIKNHKIQTRRIAFFAGTALGAIVAVLGIRVLELFVDPQIFALLPDVHQRLFRTTDVLLTGAVLGGGSDALHQLVLVFTNFMGTTAKRVKREVG